MFRQALRRLSSLLTGSLVCISLLLVSPARADDGHKQNAISSRFVKPSGKPNFLLDDWLFEARRHNASFSQGQANRGRVMGSEKMDLKGRSWKFLPFIRERKTRYGTLDLILLLERAADAVAEKYPGTLMEIGNIGTIRGGAIPQSASHQGGRDVDVAFPALDRKGRYRLAKKMLRFNRNLTARNGWKLDVRRTWTFVEALVASEEPVVQWLFVSRHIRKALVNYAREIKAPEGLIRRASTILHQPGDSTPHNDHMHIRIYCNDLEIANGCVDYGPSRSHLARDETLLTERARRLIRKSQKGLVKKRLAALEELFDLPVKTDDALARKLLCDPEPALVTRSLRHVRRHQRTQWEEIAVRKLSCSSSPDALLVLLEAISSFRHPQVWSSARAIVISPLCMQKKRPSHRLAAKIPTLCSQAAIALGYSTNLANGPLLVPLMKSPHRQVRRDALKALRTLYATRRPKPLEGDKKMSRLERWQAFVENNRNLSWAEQLHKQLIRHHVKVEEKLFARDNVEALLRAFGEGRYLSSSLQVVLSHLLGHELDRPLRPRQARDFFKKLAATREQQPTPSGKQQVSSPTVTRQESPIVVHTALLPFQTPPPQTPSPVRQKKKPSQPRRKKTKQDRESSPPPDEKLPVEENRKLPPLPEFTQD